jgi:hypothetical protein
MNTIIPALNTIYGPKKVQKNQKKNPDVRIMFLDFGKIRALK